MKRLTSVLWMPFLAALTLGVSGCGLMTRTIEPSGLVVLSKACKVFKAKSYAARPEGEKETEENKFDTDETVKDTLEYNATRDTFCEGV